MTIEQRIELLERANKRYGWALLAMVAAAAVAICVGAARDGNGELTLKKLTIQDDEGRDRIVMADDSIRWFDANGKKRISAVTTADGDADISHFDANEKLRILAITALGNASVTHLDANGKMRIMIETLTNGDASVTHIDTNGMTRIRAGTDADGTAATVHNDANGD